MKLGSPVFPNTPDFDSVYKIVREVSDVTLGLLGVRTPWVCSLTRRDAGHFFGSPKKNLRGNTTDVMKVKDKNRSFVRKNKNRNATLKKKIKSNK